MWLNRDELKQLGWLALRSDGNASASAVLAAASILESVKRPLGP
jgi:hypothetical protein